jgi:O-antigen/teichoic acid export membrane protein
MPDHTTAAAAQYDAPPCPTSVASLAASAEPSLRSRARRVARNASAVLSGQVLTWIASVLIVVTLPRYLGDSGYGRLVFAFSFTGMFGALALFGVPTLLTREIARDHERSGRLVFNALISRVPVILLAVGLMILVVYVLGYPASTQHVVWVAAGWMGVSSMSSIASAGLQGVERMTLLSAVSIIERVLVAVVGLGALAFAGAGLLTWSVVVLAGATVTATFLLVHFWRTEGLPWEPDLTVCLRLLVGGAPFLGASIALIIYGGIDVTMLSLMTREEVVGWYGAAYRFIGIPGFVAGAITMALFPAIVGASRETSTIMARRAFDVAVMVTLPVALLLVVSAGQLIELLRYPSGFQHSVILLRILAIHVPLVSISMVINTVLIARNRERAWLVLGLAAAVLNPTLNLAAIPWSAHLTGDGAIGAAIVTVITEVFIVGGSFVLVGTHTFDDSNLRIGARSATAGGLMVAAMLLVYPMVFFAVAGAGALTYGAGLLLMRATSIGEIRDLIDLVMSREAPEGAHWATQGLR